MIIADSTFFNWAESAPNNLLPDSKTSCAMPHTKLGPDLDLCLEDVSSVWYGSLPVTRSPSQQLRHIHSFDPFVHRDSVVDRCHSGQPLTLEHSGAIYDANADASSIDGLSHSHSMHYLHADMSAAAHYDTLTSFSSIDQSGTSPSPLTYLATTRAPILESHLGSQPASRPLSMPSSQFSATTSSLPIPSFGAVDNERNSSGLPPLAGDEESLPSPLYQTYPSGLSATSFATCESSANHGCYGESIIDRIDRWILAPTRYICI
jgi:hypothetical protein